tara:strand:- start:173 stop:862 length:690 start_codon:yes stop_codon:yes gene_type:complete
MFDTLWNICSYGKSFCRISPLFLNRLLEGHISESREAYYPSYKSDNLGAFFGSADYIIDHIYLGSGYHAANWEWLTENKIGYIVNVALEVDNFFPDDIEYIQLEAIRDNGEELFNYLDKIITNIRNIRDTDNYDADSEKDLLEINQSIDNVNNNRSNVLIHCLVGRSRSVTIVMAYLMKYHDMDVDQALKYVVDKRSYANPSITLLNSLREMYQKGYFSERGDKVKEEQ